MPMMHYLCAKGHYWSCYWSDDVPIQQRVDMCTICEEGSHIHLPIEILPKEIQFINNISIRLITNNTKEVN